MKLYSLNEYKPEESKSPELARVSELLKESLMQRSRSADALHIGSKGLMRSDVWIKRKYDPEMQSMGLSYSFREEGSVFAMLHLMLGLFL